MVGAYTPTDHQFNKEMSVCVCVFVIVQSQIGTDNVPCEILHVKMINSIK